MSTTSVSPTSTADREHRLLGRPVDRVDGWAKVNGAAAYTVDRTWPGMAHGFVVTSDRARATLTRMDTAAAEAAPGVVAVFTPFRPLPMNPVTSPTNPSGPAYAPLSGTEVRHYGQVIGLVVAETWEQARHAAGLVRAEYVDRTAATSLAEQLDRATLPAGTETGEPAITGFLAPGVASIDQALAASTCTVDATYSTPAQNHMAMEPHGCLAWWGPGETLHVRTGHQAITWLTHELAATFDLDPAAVDAVATYVGGGFGGKTRAGVDVKLACGASRVLGRPVKCVLTREQVFTSTVIRGMTEQRVGLGATGDGRLTAVRHESWSAEAALVSDLLVAPGHLTTRVLYRTDNMEITQRAVRLDVPRTGFMRAPAEVPGSFAIETAMDELAHRLDMDPIALRQRNDAATYPGSEVPWTGKHLAECLSRGAAAFGWSQRHPRPGNRLEGDHYVGLGVAVTAYRAFRLVPAEVEVGLHADGRVRVAGSAVDIGTGMATVLAMAAADALDLDVGRVDVHHADSALPSAGAAIGSTGTGSVAPAAHDAARAVCRRLVALATTDPRSPLYGAAAEHVAFSAGALRHGDRVVAFPELLRVLGLPELTARGRTDPQPDLDDHAHHSFGAQFCEVRVNRWTFEPRVTRMLGVMDIGRVVNRKTARSQIVGGMIWGLSTALFEALEFDPDGRLANGNAADYLVPVNADVPEAEVVFVEHPDHRHNSLGVRGAGEIGAAGMSAAIGNAIFNAIGVRVRNLPITVDKLLSGRPDG